MSTNAALRCLGGPSHGQMVAVPGSRLEVPVLRDWFKGVSFYRPTPMEEYADPSYETFAYERRLIELISPDGSVCYRERCFVSRFEPPAVATALLKALGTRNPW